MGLERFKASIEYPLQKVDDFWERMRIKSVISRTNYEDSIKKSGSSKRVSRKFT